MGDIDVDVIYDKFCVFIEMFDNINKFYLIFLYSCVFVFEMWVVFLLFLSINKIFFCLLKLEIIVFVDNWKC